ncbi:MAG: hypothetical protein C0501_14860 [Isosphaera sp.]|nr:hypothetical protein [Isosphaera sp.]
MRTAVASAVALLLAAPAAADDPPPVLKLRTELGGGDLNWAQLGAYAPDGKTVFVAAGGPNTGLVYVVDLARGEKVATLKTDPPAGVARRYPSDFAVSPDGKYVAVAYRLMDPNAGAGAKEAGWELVLWDVAGRKVAGRQRGDRWPLTRLTFGPGSKQLAGNAAGFAEEADGYKSVALVWDVPALAQKHAFDIRGHAFGALGFARENGAEVLRAYHHTGTMHRWDLATGKPVEGVTFLNRDRPAGWVSAFSPDGRTLAAVSVVSSDANGLAVGAEVSLYDAGKGGKARAVARGHKRDADRVVFSPDGKLLATTSTAGDTILWDADNLAVLTTLPTYGQVAFAPDGKSLTVGGTGYWGVDGRHLFTLGRHPTQVFAVAVNPKSGEIATGQNAPVVRVWNPRSGKNFLNVPLDPNGRTIRSVAYSPDGLTLAAVDGATVKFANADGGWVRATLTGHTSGVNAVAFSPDGKHCASASGSVRWVRDEPKQDPGEVIIWAWEREGGATAVHTLKAHPAGTFGLAWSPDGKTLATGGGEPRWGEVEAPAGATREAVRLWDVATGKPTAAFPCDPRHHVNALAWSPDGKTLAHTGVDGTRVRLLDPVTGKERFLLPAPTQGLAFSPDGSLLAAVGYGGAGNRQGLVELWDPATGKRVAAAVGHEEGVNAVAFGPDGRTLATGSGDGVLNLWDVAPPRR